MAFTREEIVASLRGQQFILPDFDTLYQGWPVACSPHLEWLRKGVDDRLYYIYSNRPDDKNASRQLKKLKGADFGYFAATWWPTASPETLLLMTYMIVWVFAWDDEFDSCQSNLGNDFAATQLFQHETLQYIANSLGVIDYVDMTKTTNNLINNFDDLASAMAPRTQPSRDRLYACLEDYIRATEVEQYERLNSSLPSLQDYIKCRMGASGVSVFFPLLDIPDAVYEHEAVSALMDTLLEQVTVMIAFTNDIVSLKKEIAGGVPDNLIPCIWQNGGSFQEAVDVAYTLLQDARHRFDKAETELLDICPAEYLSSVKVYIDACKTNCTGNWAWSAASKRYGLNDLVVPGRPTIITI